MCEVGTSNWEIVPILTLARDKLTIQKFERQWCNTLNADLNSYFPCLNEEERLEYNRRKAHEWKNRIVIGKDTVEV